MAIRLGVIDPSAPHDRSCACNGCKFAVALPKGNYVRRKTRRTFDYDRGIRSEPRAVATVVADALVVLDPQTRSYKGERVVRDTNMRAAFLNAAQKGAK